MKGLEWGRLCKEFSAKPYNPKELERQSAALMADKEVQKKKAAYTNIFFQTVHAWRN